MKKRIILILISTFSSLTVCGQDPVKPNESGQKVKTTQPVIMVIPRVKEGEDVRTILDEDFNKRHAVTKIKEAFDDRGFATRSFEGTLKKALTNQLFTSENQTDMKTQLVEMSVADIYIEVDISPLTSGPNGNSITVILEGFDCSSGISYSNKSCFSGNFNVNDTVALITRAIDRCKEEFLNTLQAAFTDIIVNGRVVIVSFKLAQNSPWTFDKEIDGIPLADMIEEWVANNSVNNNYNSQGGDLSLSYEVRIPLRDDNGKNYSSNKCALKIYNWLKTKGIESGKDVMRGTIYITIK